MKQFHVFKHADGKLEAVKQGWSWPAFLFGPLWAWYVFPRLWGCLSWIVAFIAIGLVASILATLTGMDPEGEGMQIWWPAGQIAIGSVFGFYGNRWRVSWLRRKGYQHVRTVSAENAKRAKAQFPQ